MKVLKSLSAIAVVLALKAPLLAGGMACPHMGGGSGGGKVVLLLLALAAGYGVLVLSQHQSKPLDVIGRVIGGLILVVSLIGLICVAVCGVGCAMGRFCGQKSMCAVPGMHKGACPMSGQKLDAQSAEPPAPAQPGQ